ncbi:MAG: universal stress protein [Gallionella sp.]|nr:universal stress protein [Gallionella sp.]MDD4946219.1 universal stress protein [Gallionella sp.]
MMKILIPLDGSTSAERAVQYVVGQMAELKARPQVLLLNVQWKIGTGNVKMFIDQNTINDYYREQGMAALAGGRAILDEAGLPYQYHISIGSPAEAIAQYAREQEADQVVMCRQGQGGLQQLLLGSVVSKALHLVGCPVLLVK